MISIMWVEGIDPLQKRRPAKEAMQMQIQCAWGSQSGANPRYQGAEIAKKLCEIRYPAPSWLGSARHVIIHGSRLRGENDKQGNAE